MQAVFAISPDFVKKFSFWPRSAFLVLFREVLARSRSMALSPPVARSRIVVLSGTLARSLFLVLSAILARSQALVLSGRTARSESLGALLLNGSPLTVYGALSYGWLAL